MKTDRPHHEIEELIAADALDGLEQAERDRLFREMASHGPDCPDCRSLLDEYAEVAGWLALSLDPSPVSAGAEERLLNAARGEPERRLAPAPEPTSRVMPGEAHGAPVRRSWRSRALRQGSLRRRLVAAAVAAAVAVVAGGLGWAIAPRGHGVSAQGQFIAFLGRPGSRVVTLASGPGRTLAVAYRPGEREAWVVGTNVPPPQGDHVYELWYRSGPTAKMQPAGTFVPKDGTIVTRVEVGSSFDTLAVSVEPPGGSDQPTTNPIYLVST